MENFSIVITGLAKDKVLDNEVVSKTKKFTKDLESLGVKISTSSLSAGHILGGTVDLAQPEDDTVKGADKKA